MTSIKILDYLRLLITLTNRQIIIVLLSVVVGGQAIIIYALNKKIENLDGIIISNTNGYNNNINTLQNKINEKEKEKFRIIQESQEYFRERVEKLESESRRNFREVKHIKNNE